MEKRCDFYKVAELQLQVQLPSWTLSPQLTDLSFLNSLCLVSPAVKRQDESIDLQR